MVPQRVKRPTGRQLGVHQNPAVAARPTGRWSPGPVACGPSSQIRAEIATRISSLIHARQTMGCLALEKRDSEEVPVTAMVVRHVQSACAGAT